MKMLKSKYVKDWFVHLYPNGVYALTFNLTERWLPFHQMNDEMYDFGPCPENESQKDYESRIHEVDVFLPDHNGKTSYLNSSCMNKDQCTFYFMPYDSSFIDEGKLISASFEINTTP